jgi:AcrR family transcriptional regulator
MVIIPNPLNSKEVWIKKPLQRRSKAKYEAILAALPQVLKDYGWAKTTTAKLALEADISIGSLYNYFSCKEAVLLGYLDDRLQQALETVLQAITDNRMEPTAFIRVFVRIGVDFAYEHKMLIKIALQEFPEKILNLDLSSSREKIQQIISYAAQHTTLNLKNREPQLAAYTLSNIVLGFQFRTVILPDETLSRDAIVNELTEIISDYLF